LKKKVTYIISDINKALAFEWIAERLDKEKFQLSFVLINPGFSQLEDYLQKTGVEVCRVFSSGKKSWPFALRKVYRLLKEIKPDVVHCHLFQANIIGLAAAKLAGIKRRIYTRHHSSLHHVYHPKGVVWDKLSNKLATHIVAISAVVRRILIEWEGVTENKIVLIPHGFLLNEFADVSDQRVKVIREKNNIDSDKFVIGVISRFTIWKGIQYIIPAFKKFLDDKPNAMLVLLNASGDYEKELNELLLNIPKNNYRLIAFENDIAAAYGMMNVFIHVPIDEHSEAFGQTYVEALAAGVPSVFTLAGIAPDFIQNEYNALVVPFKDSTSIYSAMLRITNEQDLKNRLICNGINSVKEKFNLDKMINALETLYES
jgi:glycosyltransferase involved in cell wall biosynthesis